MTGFDAVLAYYVRRYHRGVAHEPFRRQTSELAH